MISAGKFRQDLYHRIKVVSIKLPPLRARREDIPLLIDSFLKDSSIAHGKRVGMVSAAARKALMAYSWPGNVRELKNAIESMVVMDVDGSLDMDDLTEELQGSSAGTVEGHPGSDNLIGKSLDDVERYYIGEALKLTGGNREEAAKTLGIGERTLYRKIKDYGLN